MSGRDCFLFSILMVNTHVVFVYKMNCLERKVFCLELFLCGEQYNTKYIQKKCL